MAEIINYDEVSLLTQKCINCGKLVNPEDEDGVICPVCGVNMQIALTRKKRKIQADLDKFMKGEPMAQVKEKQQFEEDSTLDTGKREISKVKYDGSIVEIHHYWTDGKKDSATSVFTSQDQPASSFLDAQQALLDEVLFICELPEEYADNMEVRGISIGNGAVITAVKKFPDYGNKALCINTPHMMFSDSIRDDDKSSVPLPSRTAEAVKNWAKEAEAFLAGKRHANQLKLVTTETAA